MLARLFAAALLLAVFTAPVRANPADELLRVTPPDAAFVLVVQNARGHVEKLRESPFAAWFPGTPVGKRLLDSPDARKLREAVRVVCQQTETTPEILLNDILGDAVAFSFQPSHGGDPKQERGLLLIRPAKIETLERLITRLNQLQKDSGEIQDVITHKHEGTTYTQRKKADGLSEFYCLRNGTFAFSSSPDELRSFLDRDRKAALTTANPPALAEVMTKLGLEQAVAVLLVNPRILDGEMKTKAARGKPEEQAFLTWFATYWQSLDAAALFLRLDQNVEAGLALRVRDGAKAFVGPDSLIASGLWASIPEDAIFAVAGRQKVSDLVDSLGHLLPEEGRRAIRGVVEQTLGPVIGRDKLPLVIDALGPDWGLWFELPRDNAFLPVPVMALEVQTGGPKGEEAARALMGAIDYGFQTARVVHNSRNAQQIDLLETKQGNTVIKSLVGEKTFPTAVRPSFALKDGFLLLTASADAIERFRRPPAAGNAPVAEVPLLRFSATSARGYLQTQSEPLSKFLAERTATPAPDLGRTLRHLAEALEPFDRWEAFTRPAGQTVHFAVRVKLAKPLAK